MKKITYFLGIAILFCLLSRSAAIAAADEQNTNSFLKKISVSSTPTDDRERLMLDNFLGKDTSLRATGRISEDDLYLEGGLEKKHIFDTPYFAGFDINGRRWHENEFDLDGGGVDLYVGRHIDGPFSATLKYKFDDLRISGTDSQSAVDFSRHQGTNYNASADLRVNYYTADNRIYPTKGAQAEGLFAVAAKAIGGDFNYAKVLLEGTYYTTPFMDITLSAHASAGYIGRFGGSEDVPFFERYFVGSGSTVRGFKWGHAGPLSQQDNALGGDGMVVGNLEARLPIYRQLKGVLFFDTGKAFEKLNDFTRTDMRESAGLGLRYLTPWVVLRADYGFILDRKEDDGVGRLHLTVGVPF